MRFLAIVFVCPFFAWSYGVQAESPIPVEEDYSLVVKIEPTLIQKAKNAQYRLTIHPKKNWVLKTVTPLTVDLSASEGLHFDKDKLRAKDIVSSDTKEKTVTTNFKTEKVGDYYIKASVTFFLCTEEICKRFRDKAEIKFNVK